MNASLCAFCALCFGYKVGLFLFFLPILKGQEWSGWMMYKAQASSDNRVR